MEIRLLEYFVTVSEELHFTRAAARLGISQPTLSHQIQLLEHRVGQPLFHRINKRVYLTEAGQILLKHARNIFNEIEQAQTAISDLSRMQRGQVRIGCSGNHLLTPVIVSFHQYHPGVELSVRELSTDETVSGLLNHQLDIGLGFLPVEEEKLEAIPLFEELLCLAVASAHPLAERTSVGLSELHHYPVAQLPSKFFARKIIDQLSEQSGSILKPEFEWSTLEALLQVARQQVAVSILPRSYLNTIHDPSIVRIPIVDPVPRRTIGILYRKRGFLGAAMQLFIDELTRHLRQEESNQPPSPQS